MAKQRIPTRIGVDNIPPELMKRLIGAANKEMIGVSAKVRQCLDESLPPLEEVIPYLKKQA